MLKKQVDASLGERARNVCAMAATAEPEAERGSTEQSNKKMARSKDPRSKDDTKHQKFNCHLVRSGRSACHEVSGLSDWLVECDVYDVNDVMCLSMCPVAPWARAQCPTTSIPFGIIRTYDTTSQNIMPGILYSIRVRTVRQLGGKR